MIFQQPWPAKAGLIALLKANYTWNLFDNQPVTML